MRAFPPSDYDDIETFEVPWFQPLVVSLVFLTIILFITKAL
jgi:hypothetical protein